MPQTEEARAGFDSINNGGAPVPAPEPAPPAAEAVPATPAAADPPPAAEPAPIAADPAAPPADDALTAEQLEAIANDDPNPLKGYTKEQLDRAFSKIGEIDKIEKSLRDAHGKIGGLNGAVQEMRAPRADPVPAAAPVVEDDTVDPDFATTYPEFATELRKVAARASKGGMSQDDVDKLVAARVGEVRVQMAAEAASQREMDQMTMLHPDWQGVVHSDAYNAWKSMQPPDVQEKANTTDSAKELGDIITSFKTFTAPAAPPDQSRNQRRLSAATTPSGTPQRTPVASTPADEARAGFNAVAARTTH